MSDNTQTIKFLSLERMQEYNDLIKSKMDLDNESQTLANKKYVEDTVAALVNSAPDKLNTLDELAAALGDDENFATTVTNAIALKAGKIVTGQSFVVNGETVVANNGAEVFNNDSNKATGAYSHAEGNYTNAIGNCSHAEGSNTTASGVSSHAEGTGTVASVREAHAEGNHTIASAYSQHVQGKYNIESTSLAHIVGNGSADDARSNAHTLDFEGNAWYAGDVYVGSTSGTNKDAGSKKLATEEYINVRVPAWTEADEGKVLRIVNGTPTWVALPNAEEASF